MTKRHWAEEDLLPPLSPATFVEKLSAVLSLVFALTVLFTFCTLVTFGLVWTGLVLFGG